MTTQYHGTDLRAIGLGIFVDRATAGLPASTSAALFTIAGGRALITSLVGRVTTAIQNQACSAKLIYDPSATGSNFDLCTAVDLANDAVEQTYYIAGDVGTPGALLVAGAVGQANPVFAKPLLLQAGSILLDTTATNTGSVQWSLTYVPYDADATVVAA